MAVDMGALVTLGLAVIGGGVWLIRLEGRVDKGEALHKELKANHADLRADVQYIRQRIDEVLNR